MLYFVQNKLYEKYWDHGLKVSVEFSKNQVVQGDQVDLIEVISNEKILPLLMVRLKFKTDRSLRFTDIEENVAVSDKTYKNDIFSLLFYQKITRRIPCKCTGRGVFNIEEVELVSANLFLSVDYIDTVPVFSQITVYPKVADAKQLAIPFRTMMGELLSRKRLYEDPFEFRSIREYTGMETMGAINWKATARTGDLKVNVHGNTSSQKTCILLNLDTETNWSSDRLVEECISIAAGLSDMLMKANVAVSLVTNAVDVFTKEEIVLDDGNSSLHMDRLLTALAHIDAKAEHRSFVEVLSQMQSQHSQSSDTLYVMISIASGVTLQNALEDFSKNLGDSMWILPYEHQPEFSISDLAHVSVYPWEVQL